MQNPTGQRFLGMLRKTLLGKGSRYLTHDNDKLWKQKLGKGSQHMLCTTMKQKINEKHA
jgi:hypothetical protein